MDNYSTLVDLIIKEELQGKPSHERLIKLGKTPNYLIDHAGFPALELAIKGSVITKACFDHGIATSMLKRLPDIVANPKCLFKSASRPEESVVVLTFEVKGKAELPIIVPISRNMSVGRENVNLVASIYGKEGPNPEQKWKTQGLLIYEFKG